MFEIAAERRQGLPALAWAATISRGKLSVPVIHGDYVHVDGGFLVEGAWSGPFDQRGFLAARHVLGSGLVAAETLMVRGTTHTLERLWGIRRPTSLVVSNSLPLACAITGMKFPLHDVHAEADLLSFIDGVSNIRSPFAKIGDGILHQWACANLEVHRDLSWTVVSPETSPSISTFSDFESEVLSVASEVCRNAADAKRTIKFRPLATVSRGYDSPACAAVAKRCGATEAITFSEARTGYESSSDDGTEIAIALGMQCRQLQRDAYMAGDGVAEMAFLASGGGGEDVVLAAAAEPLRHSVVFTGFLGDTLWGMTGDPDGSRGMRIRYPGGGSIGEYRLQTGFVHVPVPILFLDQHASVLAVSHCAEMAPWRLGTEYDRPIPRRMAEEAGAARESFGSTKMAITAPMYYDQALADILGPQALAAFSAFISEHRREVDAILAQYESDRVVPLRRLRLKERLFGRATRIPLLRALARRLEPRLSDRWRRGPSESLFLVHWAVNTLSARYSVALAERQGAVPT